MRLSATRRGPSRPVWKTCECFFLFIYLFFFLRFSGFRLVSRAENRPRWTWRCSVSYARWSWPWALGPGATIWTIWLTTPGARGCVPAIRPLPIVPAKVWTKCPRIYPRTSKDCTFMYIFIYYILSHIIIFFLFMIKMCCKFYWKQKNKFCSCLRLRIEWNPNIPKRVMTDLWQTLLSSMFHPSIDLATPPSVLCITGFLFQ